MLKHNLGSTTEKKKKKESARARLQRLRLHLTAAPFPLDHRSLTSVPICLLFPTSLGGPGRAPRVSLAAHRAPGASRLLPRPVSASLAQNFGRSLPAASSLRCSGALPAARLHRRPSRPADPPRCLGGAGNRRANKEPNSEEATERPSHPILSLSIPSHPCRPALERGW